MEDQNQQDRDNGKKPVKVLTANDIFAVEDIKIVPVDIPEWGGMVYVKGMKAVERERYFDTLRKTIGTGRKAREKVVLEKSSALLVSMTCCDAQGNLLFTREDVAALALKSAKPMERITDAASKLNGLDEDEAEVEERKNV